MLGPSFGAVRRIAQRASWWPLAGCLVLILVVGCEPPAAVLSPAEKPAAPADRSVREYWDAIYFEDVKVGHAHLQYKNIEEDGKALVEIRSTGTLTLGRFGQSVSQELQVVSVETPSGEVVRMESTMTNAGPTGNPLAMTTTGRVEGDQLRLDTSTLGKKVSATIPWDKTWGGFFAMEQTLERQPMKAGEKRTFRALVPGFNTVADIEYRAIGLESTKLLDGARELLRIETKLKLAGNSLEQTIWTDTAGQTIKSHMPALKQTTYRTTREVARELTKERFDIGDRMIVPIAKKFENPHQSRRATYRATFTSGDPSQAFVSGATQQINKIDERTIELQVRSLLPKDQLGTEFPRDQSPTDDDRTPNALIQSDDPEVVKLAESVAVGKSDSWEIAVALEQFVKQHVSTKSFSQALASAAEVARSREGDCTEHAVLLAAMCRAKQIPSRVAMGLVYFPASSGFAYHMWTEVWQADRWIPIDATLGRGGIGAAHLKISTSNLKGADPLSQFLPVFQLIGNIRLELVSSE